MIVNRFRVFIIIITLGFFFFAFYRELATRAFNDVVKPRGKRGPIDEHGISSVKRFRFLLLWLLPPLSEHFNSVGRSFNNDININTREEIAYNHNVECAHSTHNGIMNNIPD